MSRLRGNLCFVYSEIIRLQGDSLFNLSKIFLILLSTITLSVFASTQDEINHLISFISSTDCKYERNGKMHSGSEAIEHINKKYAYFSDNINSTEDFIKYSATKSKISGKFYKIHCSNKEPINSQDWLLNELKAYRASQK